MVDAPLLYPYRTRVPMGFASSSAWVQEFIDTVTAKAPCPEVARVLISRPLPNVFLAWGSVVDDTWGCRRMLG